jgi:hypothetical protein
VAGSRRTLWTCPECGHRFVTRNLWHSCGRYSLAAHFAGKARGVRAVFDRYLAAARACGPVTVYAQKTRIVFQTRVRFAGAVVRRDWVEATMWLRRPVRHRTLVRVEPLGRLGFNLHFRLETPADVDGALRELLREAYEAGRGNPGERGSARRQAAVGTRSRGAGDGRGRRARRGRKRNSSKPTMMSA